MSAVLDKIIKLLSLAEGKGTTPAEAATAAAQANRLMLKHSISHAQLDDHQPTSEPIDHATIHIMGKRCINWRVGLANGIAQLHTCRVMAGYGRIDVVGRYSDRQIVDYLYRYLSREIERLAEDERKRHTRGVLDFTCDEPWDTSPRGKGWYDSYKKGAVVTVIARLRVDRAEHMAEVKETHSTALVRINAHDLAVEAHFSSISGGKRQGYGASTNSGYTQGKAAGNRIVLNKGLNGAPVKRLGNR